ncbi:MAG: phage portal protein [Planctomycetaceae bacterium]
MLTFLRDRFRTLRLKARYQRLVQERVLELIEAASPKVVSDDETGWTLLGDSSRTLSDSERADYRTRARRFVREQPHARNALRLLENYVVGAGLELAHMPSEDDREDNNQSRGVPPRSGPTRPGSAEELSSLAGAADRLWSEFLRANRRHFTFREQARRVWRDGECFLRVFPSSGWPPAVRFIDPEAIGPTREHPDSQGVLTEPHDVEAATAYLRIDPETGELAERIAAEEVFHTRIGIDSNQKRGLTAFAPVIETLAAFNQWLDTELVARKLLASIVLWRKVSGAPTQTTAFADSADYSSASDALHAIQCARVAGGTMLTTSTGTEFQFLQPSTNYTDAVPLGRLMLLCIAAGMGLPEYMLTSDASNANYASTMVAEGPAVKLFESEQEFFAAEFESLWRWVMTEAVRQGRLPADFFEQIKPKWMFPLLVNRDRPRERDADVKLVSARILSRAEVARRDGVDPAAMQREIGEEGNAA